MLGLFKNRKLKKEALRAVRDGLLTTDERQALTQLAADSGADYRQIDEVIKADFNRRTRGILDRIGTSRRMTRADLQEIYTIADSLGIEPDLGEALEKCWLLRCWEDGEPLELQGIAASLMLAKGEICYFRGQSTWAQMKTLKTRQGSSGFSMSFRIAKGLRYRVGNVRPHYVSHDTLIEVASGELSVTNKRIIFEGFPKSQAIQHRRIVDINLHQNGIEIAKNSGKNDFFALSELDAEFVQMLATHFH